MAKIRKPISFSKHFDIDPDELKKVGAFDPILNVDTKLFIDPLLLKRSSQTEIRVNAVIVLENILRILSNFLKFLVRWGTWLGERQGSYSSFMKLKAHA